MPQSLKSNDRNTCRMVYIALAGDAASKHRYTPRCHIVTVSVVSVLVMSFRSWKWQWCTVGGEWHFAALQSSAAIWAWRKK